MIIACATNEGSKFVTCHFGEAEKYYIYDLNEKGYILLAVIDNNTGEEDEGVHADVKKAKGITGLLKESSVQVVITKVFGPNIKRIVNHFVPIIASSDNVEDGLNALVTNYSKINELLVKNSGDTYFNLKNNSEVKINVQ
jgi:predicted Fe-Mo cluster-binding NifX family protein